MGSPPDAERRERAARAELVVVRWLEARGYEVVATNLRVGRLELDVIARLGPVVAVVEVRTRSASAWTTGFGSIDPAKRQRIRRAGERLWQRRYKNDPSVERIRFDAASVSFGPDGEATVEYALAAF